MPPGPLHGFVNVLEKIPANTLPPAIHKYFLLRYIFHIRKLPTSKLLKTGPDIYFPGQFHAFNRAGGMAKLIYLLERYSKSVKPGIPIDG